MIFGTTAERDATINAIHERKAIKDISANDMDCIHGFYWAMEALDNYRAELEFECEEDSLVDKLVTEIMTNTVDEAIEKIEMEAVNMVAAFRDNFEED